MPVLFQSRPGAVVRIDDDAVQCSARLLTLPAAQAITQGVQNSIVTRMTINQQVNLQFLHSLGSLIYVYVFGDRMGAMSLSGLSFGCGCDGQDAEHGASLMLAWYNTFRASKQEAPVRLTIGRTVVEGFVTGVAEDVVDPSLGLVQWTVAMNSVPED